MPTLPPMNIPESVSLGSLRIKSIRLFRGMWIWWAESQYAAKVERLVLLLETETTSTYNVYQKEKQQEPPSSTLRLNQTSSEIQEIAILMCLPFARVRIQYLKFGSAITRSPYTTTHPTFLPGNSSIANIFFVFPEHFTHNNNPHFASFVPVFISFLLQFCCSTVFNISSILHFHRHHQLWNPAWHLPGEEWILSILSTHHQSGDLQWRRRREENEKEIIVTSLNH